MTDQDILNLTGEDLKLITKIAYRISKKGFIVSYKIQQIIAIIYNIINLQILNIVIYKQY